ncbi:hypothetical protein Trydic_g14478 [Trypoxylus dichotomus]
MKAFSELGSKILINLLNHSREDKKTPKDWKVEDVCPIYEEGDSQQWTNYKVIAVGSTTGKAYERLLEASLKARTVR